MAWERQNSGRRLRLAARSTTSDRKNRRVAEGNDPSPSQRLLRDFTGSHLLHFPRKHPPKVLWIRAIWPTISRRSCLRRKRARMEPAASGTLAFRVRLRVIDRHKICGDLCRPSLGYGRRSRLLVSLENLLKCTTVAGGPRYRYSSIDIAGRASERAITIAARYRMVHHRKNPSARSIALFSSWNRVCVIRPLQCQGFTVRNPPTFPDCLHQLERNPSVLDRLTHSGPSPLPLPGQLSS